MELQFHHNDFIKTFKVIRSCENEMHIEVAANMVECLRKKYPRTELLEKVNIALKEKSLTFKN